MDNYGQNYNERIFITGGNKLCGDVNISGAKNAALPLMALSLIINEDFKLSNVPDLADTRLMLRLLQDLGIKSKWNNHINTELHKTGKRKIRSDCKNPLNCNECEYITKNNITLKKHILNNAQ